MGENPHPKPWNASCHVGKKQSFAKNPAVLKGPWTKVSPSFGSLFAPSAAQPDVVCYTGAAAALKVCTEAKTPSVTNSGHHWGAVAQTFHLCALTARLQQAAAKFLPAYTSLRLILLLGQGGVMQHSLEWNPAVLLACFQKRFFYLPSSPPSTPSINWVTGASLLSEGSSLPIKSIQETLNEISQSITETQKQNNHFSDWSAWATSATNPLSPPLENSIAGYSRPSGGFCNTGYCSLGSYLEATWIELKIIFRVGGPINH